MSEFILGDCMDYLKDYPDNHFDLAIVDPPYGDGTGKDGGNTWNRFGQRFDRYKNPGEVCRAGGQWAKKYGKKIISWDKAPSREYFKELFRVTRKQIIFGGNYFDLPPTRNFIVWRKTQIPEKFTMSMVEYAWTNIAGNAKMFECHSQRGKESGAFHPSEKPIRLYTWLLANYAEKGDFILDTHVGSASSLIACEQMGFEYVGFEIDETYYKLATERLEAERAQIKMEIF